MAEVVPYKEVSLQHPEQFQVPDDDGIRTLHWRCQKCGSHGYIWRDLMNFYGDKTVNGLYVSAMATHALRAPQCDGLMALPAPDEPTEPALPESSQNLLE